MDFLYQAFVNGEIKKISKNEYLSTGLSDLDKSLGGGLKKDEQQAYLIAANKGVGSTALAIRFTQSLIEAKQKVLYLCMDDGNEKIARRLVLSMAGIKILDYENDNCSKEDRLRLEETCDSLNEEYNCVLSDDIFKLTDIHRALMSSQAKFLIVDSLEAISSPENEEIILKELLLICRNLNVIPIVVVDLEETYTMNDFIEEDEISKFETRFNGIKKLATLLVLDWENRVIERCFKKYILRLDIINETDNNTINVLRAGDTIVDMPKSYNMYLSLRGDE